MSTRPNDLAHIRFISAGAGSGKTYRLTQELKRALSGGTARPAGVIATTFTVKAASELHDRVRERLIKSGHATRAEQMAQALIGTVQSVCERLLARFAFELGLSPELDVASVEDGARLFNQALDEVLSADRVRKMNLCAARLDLIDERSGRSWQDHVKKIVDQARSNDIAAGALATMSWRQTDDTNAGGRSNDIAAGALATMGRESAERFLRHFPEATCDEQATAALKEAIHEALGSIDLESDTTKGTAAYVDGLRDAAAMLGRDECPWTLWIGLSKKVPRKKSEAAAAPVRAAASCYDRHAGFHADIRAYVKGVFAIAGEALARFQAIKTERGLIDYEDMEQLALRALDKPAVRERLGDELQLLLVDEFQDTNPMQLALFMKLARFARKVIFVGDVKQAIYGFRGSDPELVHRTLDALGARGCSRDVLERSWRSRPPLVWYLNTVFATAFERDGIDRALVELAPEREETHGAPAVMRWTLPKAKATEQAEALAGAIADLVDSQHDSQHTVNDPKKTGETRAVRYGDVAVLAATNSHVETIAGALRARGVPMKMTLSGLLAVPEVCLARACLRRLNDSSDTLATAEIRALGACEEPELWLADRLRWLAAGEDDRRWGEAEDSIVSRIARLREQAVTQSPVEIVARVLNYVSIRPIATAWGPDAIRAAQRQRNLDAFLELAVMYENHCATQHEAATLTGFLFWLEHPSSPELDLQPVVTGGDAVHVLTYHRAKGLEWPVVVATDFYYTWRSRIWGVRSLSGTEPLDIDNSLAGRSIRFFPNVFGRNTKGVPVLDAVMESEEAVSSAEADAAEGRRLAYVGMTRARDTIIVVVPPSEPGNDAWIRSFASEHLLATGDVLALPEGKPIPSSSRVLAGPDPAEIDTDPFTPAWFPERAPIESPLRERRSPSEAKPVEGAAVGEIIETGPRMRVHGEDMTGVGTALHAVIAAEFVNPERDDAVEGAAALITAFAGEGAVAPADAVGCARRLRALLHARFTPLRMLVEHPVQMRHANGQVLRGWIDLLLETDAGWIVIDHKSSPRPRSEWADEGIGYSGQLAAYATALRAADMECAGCWLHLPVGGGLLEIVLPRTSSHALTGRGVGPRAPS